MQLVPLALAASIVASAVSAQTTTVSPIANATLEGDSNNAFPFNATTLRRYMQIHGDVSAVPVAINKLEFRVNASTTNYTGTKTFDMELFLGHANTDAIANPSLTFAANYAGAPSTGIARMNITFGPTGQATSPGPNPFTMALPIAPFLYSGASPLIWEAVIHGVTSTGTTSQLDADQSPTTTGSSTVTGTGCIASTQGTAAMTHTVVNADVSGILHLSFTVSLGPASAPCVLAIGTSNPNLAYPGLCSNILTDLTTIVPYGTTSASGAITGDAPPIALFRPNTFRGATLFTQVHAIDVGRADPIPMCNSNGRQTTLPLRGTSPMNAVTRLWNNVGGAGATQALFTTSTVGYGLVTQFTY